MKLLAVLTAVWSAVLAAQPLDNTNNRRAATLGPAVVRWEAPWTPSGIVYRNATELVIKGAGGQNAARVLSTTEPRTSPADAVQRLSEIAAEHQATAKFLQIGGWPAVEIIYTEPLPRRGQERPHERERVPPPQQHQRAVVAIAVDSSIVRFDIDLAPDAPSTHMESALRIAHSPELPPNANANAVPQLLQEMQRRDNERKAAPPQPAPASPPQPPAAAPPAAMTLGTPAAAAAPAAAAIGAPVQAQSGNGELEVAVSANGNNVVLASNSALSFSTNRGNTFSAGTTGVFGLNDPSLARGASGNFYLDVIAVPSGTPAQLGVSGCTNAVNRSTNNGASFALRGYSARCPLTGAVCFPDQEHLAADAFNAAPGGDQLYAVWRNFTTTASVSSCAAIGSGSVTASITCSQDSGAAWTATTVIPGAGDFPRVAVGRDGTVFVVTISGTSVLLNRFTSCSAGLTPSAGYPKTVATLGGMVACPVPGLDRCNDGNVLASPTVAPDPNNANHLFVAFAERDGSGERVVRMESTTRGDLFGPRVTLSGAAGVRRFLPWSCSTRGTAFVAWYDRGAGGDRTDYLMGGFGGPSNLTNNPDPQCASGFPCGCRATADASTCSVSCDPSGGGCPKYGDYNGIACAGDYVYAAWASATPPAGLTAPAGINVFSSRVFVGLPGAAIWRSTGAPCSGESCPGWQKLDNNPKTVAIAAGGGNLYQLHNDGWIWRFTGTPCDDPGSCPSWQRLDDNSKTVAIAANDTQLFQLHNDGWIWRYSGTPCSGDSCPGWQRLDNNSRTVAIAAAGTALYQLHTGGRIWRYTGTPCSGDSCTGWQMLDDNPKTVAIAAGGGNLYQLHNDGWIWRFTGTPCSGESCTGWQRLDDNNKTVAIAAGGGNLYQLHNDGWIWRFTGTPCSGDSCPGWQRLDDNNKTTSIAASGSNLYQLHNDGWIWRSTGTPCSGDSCPGWQRFDNNPRSGMIAAGDQLFQLHTDPLYQRHSTGAIWRYTGSECVGDVCPGWQQLDNNAATAEIVAAGGQLFQRHSNGRIWRSTGVPCNGSSCPGWQMLDNNPASVQIAAGGTSLYQRHSTGAIWRYTGTPCSGTSCPGWQQLDNNSAAVSIAASGSQLYQLHNNGRIWRHTGTPCSGTSCPGWQMLDNNAATTAIVAAGKQLFQRHSDGTIWRYTGTPCSGTSCPGWQMLDNNAHTIQITAVGAQLYQLHDTGAIWRYTGTPCSGTSCPGWQQIDNNPLARQIIAGGDHLYQRHSTGAIWRYSGPPCSGASCPGWQRLDNNPATAAIAAGGFQ